MRWEPPFVGQVNLVSGRAVTPEVLLRDEDPFPLIQAIEPLVTDTHSWHAQMAEIAWLRERVLGRGAVEHSAQLLSRRFR